MKGAIKVYLRNLAKNHLIIFAFGFLGLLILAGTIIINVFWGGCVRLPLAQDNATIKDYMTLYLSMLSVVATLFASFVVIYAYDIWKEQHNKTVLAEEAKIIWKEINEASHNFTAIRGLKDLNFLTETYVNDSQRIKIHVDRAMETIINSTQKTIYLGKLSDNPQFNENLHSIAPHLKTFGENFKHAYTNKVTVDDFYKMQEESYKNILRELNKTLKELEAYILIK
ncbi:hypothetical protein KTI78_02580 [Acinetobacter sp. WU_MDCI_Abxe161]|uniref:hypothetical protein n=1 Tax=Acinetobacter sp. WU_MDCI_Abxe161 TaxID=2850074 RepID=UPI0021CD6719|nr:hypothetical protein [Acinetobacter sp. WU_MDCI_Abxe161]MCU4502045.1 hypothetical protein [Acinetobacter sp. WU_MDCI_Abxe161]